MSDQIPPVYPIGLLVMGTELKLGQPRATLAKVQGLEPEGPPRHWVRPYVYNVCRFSPAGLLVPFGMSRKSVIRVESIHAFGPALIERVVMSAVVLYDKQATSEGDGKLFYCPHQILEESHGLEVDLRCLPELFMLRGRNPEQKEDFSPEDLELLRSHDPLQCDDCVDFRKRTGLSP